jgi:membrane-bound lytic murein transglycosylase D
VQREWEWYVAHPEYLERVQERARPYLHYILNEVQARGLPGELALLPVVESAYQPFAYSPGRASGIWQFIPSTGRHFGLKQTWWYDGRRDIMASTEAALDYLAQLNSEFDGDWELALAAYNTGGGNLRKAIKRNRRRGRPTDFWSLDLPRETEAYVPRLLAISRLMADPAAAGVTLAQIPDTPYFQSIATGGQLDLAMAADMAGLSMDELYTLNPAYNRWATDPDGPHRLLVPIERAGQLEQGLSSLAPEQRVRWERYHIARGDSLIEIARNHHTTVEVLRQANGIKGSRITAGRHLLIPVAARTPDHYAQSADQRLARIQDSPRGKHKVEYLVQPGDTLWDIARAHHVGFRELARWNAMAPADTLRPGQQLVVWKQPAGTVAARPPGTRSTLRYRVRRGDSLYKISQRFKVSIADLRQWNNLHGKKYLQPGQNLKVLVDVTEQTAPL